jgi:hypothetical protein
MYWFMVLGAGGEDFLAEWSIAKGLREWGKKRGREKEGERERERERKRERSHSFESICNQHNPFMREEPSLLKYFPTLLHSH